MTEKFIEVIRERDGFRRLIEEKNLEKSRQLYGYVPVTEYEAKREIPIEHRPVEMRKRGRPKKRRT